MTTCAGATGLLLLGRTGEHSPYVGELPAGLLVLPAGTALPVSLSGPGPAGCALAFTAAGTALRLATVLVAFGLRTGHRSAAPVDRKAVA
jgi:hypothetical protein